MKDISKAQLELAANTIRGLSMDGVQAANSGHPGLPMGMADVAATLFLGYLEHSPADPKWINRDRFVLSGGHGSMLLYSLLHLSGYDLPLEELKKFRQWNSKTPGHPEYGHTPGVETTTGPLGQGCANAVGMALAERMLAARLNSEDYAPIDHRTFVFCGDGDLMEGISHEAFSTAGHLGLNKLVVFYDSNRITIEGSTDLACSDDVKKRFQGYNFSVIEIDAHDYEQIEKAIRRACREKSRPTVVICKSHIGKGSPNKVDTAAAHGEPLGPEEVKLSKANIGLPADRDFYIPEEVKAMFKARCDRMKKKSSRWNRDLKKKMEESADFAAKWNSFFNFQLPADIEAILPKFEAGSAVATRAASGKVMQALAGAIPNFVGGSADLAPSTKTYINSSPSVGPGAFSGKNLHFGIREHAMGAIMNGMILHGGFRVFGATFFVFVDYLRPALRLAALSHVPAIYVFTHDSFYVGEDGPTHEPVEHLASLRCMPNVTLIRPADPTETGAAWIAALKNTTGPTAIMLTRQNLNVIDRSVYPVASNLEKGAYTLWQSGAGTPDVILIGSGSEVGLALEAGTKLAAEMNVRVVSMPSWELFEKQDASYREEVLPPACAKRVAVEAGVSMGWERYVGEKGATVCMDRFGASAPYKVLEKEFGFTVENVVATVRGILGF